jgi:succinate dehydrogenase / fumarate reductase cytochrome b subunit
MSAAKKPRPVHRNVNPADLFRYRLPLPGIVSILHRISGALLFAMLWFLLAMLQMSLSSEAGFNGFRSAFAHPAVKVVFLALLWAFLHHLVAGLRYVWIDVSHAAAELPRARRSSAVTLGVSLALTVLLGAKLW